MLRQYDDAAQPAALQRSAKSWQPSDTARVLGNFQAICDAVPVGLCLIDRDLRFIGLNRRLAEMTGRTAEDSIGRTLVEVTPGVAAQLDPALRRALRGETVHDLELHATLVGTACEGRAFLVSLQPMPGPEGNVAAALCSVLDITDRKRAEAALAKSESRLRRAISVGRMTAWEWDLATDALYATARLHELFGRPPASLRTMDAAVRCVHPEDLPRVTAIMQKTLSGNATADDTVEFRVVWPDGTLRWLHSRGRVEARNGDEPRRVVGITSDITERKRNEARITWLAHYDPLTRLANRTLFRQRLEEVLAGLDRRDDLLALHWMDFDQFKCINDTLGHPAGDSLLREAAARLKACIPPASIAARVGGDEFAVIQTGLRTPAEAEALAGRMLEALSDPFFIEGRQLSGGASIGIAIAPQDSRDADEIVKKADIALYQAKADGGASVRLFVPEMDDAVRRRQEMTARLRQALAQNELALHYQPLVSMRSGGIACVEALLRWPDSGQCLGSAPAFISSAEEAGLIVPLGRWVLRTACIEAARWSDPVRVAVNLSPVQFRNPGLLDAVTGALADSGLPAERLELEITESVLLHHTPANLAALHELRALGVRIALDDFGTGYSSLGYLHRFPFDKIKIDRSFISELPGQSAAKAIVRSVIGLGRTLGMTIAAEGVETTAQLEWLRNEACDQVQGFLLSRPVPAQQIAAAVQQARQALAAAI